VFEPGAGFITSSRKRPTMVRSATMPVVTTGVASGVGRIVMTTLQTPARRASSSASGPGSCMRSMADRAAALRVGCACNAGAVVTAMASARMSAVHE
jgi:hypothetical protein